jgi:2'-5' RNA ligase
MLLKPDIRRVFWAINVPTQIENTSRIIQQNNTSLKGIRWVQLNNLHLTIYFAGNIHSHYYEYLFNYSKEIINSISAFTLVPETICNMPEHNPRMLWAKYKTHPEFSALYHKLYITLSKYSIEKLKMYETPIPHITLLRYKNSEKAKQINFNSEIELPEICVSNIQLWETPSSVINSNYIKDKRILMLNNI